MDATKFTGTLSKGFVLAKPIKPEDYDESILKDLQDAGRLIITRKRDGWKMFAGIDENNNVALYTDGINEFDDRLRNVKEEILSIGFPPNTLLVGELLATDRDKDAYTNLLRMLKTRQEKVRDVEKIVGALQFMVFNIIFLNGERVYKPYSEVLKLLNELIPKHAISVKRVSVLSMPLGTAKIVVRAEGWEGLVLYDTEYRITYREDGKNPQRPKGCYKWKPLFEDDFIVQSSILRQDGTEVKELILSQIDPRSGKEFECGKLGSLTRKIRMELVNAQYPFVVQVAFELRFASGKLRHARFMRLRPDKDTAHCIAPISYAQT